MQFAMCNYGFFWKATTCFIYINWSISLLCVQKY